MNVIVSFKTKLRTEMQTLFADPYMNDFWEGPVFSAVNCVEVCICICAHLQLYCACVCAACIFLTYWAPRSDLKHQSVNWQYPLRDCNFMQITCAYACICAHMQP